jgi:hypothetical protein
LVLPLNDPVDFGGGEVMIALATAFVAAEILKQQFESNHLFDDQYDDPRHEVEKRNQQLVVCQVLLHGLADRFFVKPKHFLMDLAEEVAQHQYGNCRECIYAGVDQHAP